MNKIIKIILLWFINTSYIFGLITVSGLIGIYGVQLKWFIYNGCPYKAGDLFSINACSSEWNITLGVLSACVCLIIYIQTNKYITKLIEWIRR